MKSCRKYRITLSSVFHDKKFMLKSDDSEALINNLITESDTM